MQRLLVGSRVLVVTTLIVVALVSQPLHATSDAIRINRGTLFQPNDLTGDFSVEGTSGLKIDAALAPHFASIAWSFCHLRPCLAGEELSLFAGYGAFIFTGSGQATLRGQTYTLWTADAESADLDFEFDGAFVLPEFTAGGAELTAPFTFSGSLRVPNEDELGTHEVVELHGAGVATVTLVPHPFTLTSWVVASVKYDFLPHANVLRG